MIDQKQKFITEIDLSEMDNRSRVHLVNAITGFKSVSLIGTQNAQNENLAIFSSVMHLGSNPALLGFIVRPASVSRNTLDNILETGFYTVNHINENIFNAAHQTSARYESIISEFDETGLTPEYKNDFKAPFVAESAIQIGLEFKEKIDININNTILIIGEIKQIYFPLNCLCSDGYLDIEKAKTITCSGLDSYHTTKRIDRLTYAKPNTIAIATTLKYIE